MRRKTSRIHFPRYAAVHYGPYDSGLHRYHCLFGGRSSSKTWTVAGLLILDATQREVRVAVGREHQTSMEQTAKKALEKTIIRYGLSNFFTVQREKIIGANGSEFFFKGIESNPHDIRGWEDVDHVWIEEAQFMSEATARILIPTIRKKHSQLWFTWNPNYRSDWVWRRFIINGRDTDLTTKVNWRDNPWFPVEVEEERLNDYNYNPEQYAHIWEGEPDDEGSERKVLPFAMIQDCLKAWTEFRQTHVKEILEGETPQLVKQAGLDVADTGADFNAFVERKGPLLLNAQKWREKLIGNTARRADRISRRRGINRVFYDAGGVGAGVRSYFADFEDRPYSVRPELFGGEVKGKQTMYSYRINNEMAFKRRNAQMAWALRVRATNTRALLAGDDVDPARCLFINPEIERIEEFMAQLTQPAWTRGTTDRIEIIKHDEKEPSPDLYDAAVLAFARDSLYGLKYK